MARLRRYREEADGSLGTRRGIEETARRFSGRLFAGLEYTAALGRGAGFGVEAERSGDLLTLRVEVSPGTGEARATFGSPTRARARQSMALMVRA